MQFAAAIGITALSAAWQKTLRAGGGPGGDGETVAQFARAAESRLARLAYELESGSYRPGPLRRLSVPKSSGGNRVLSIPCVIDRIAQRAAATVLSVALDPHFEDTSFAYRPGRSVAQAVARVDLLRRQGYHYVVDGDIRTYFDAVPHAPLLDKLTAHRIEPRLIDLVALWLDSFSDEARGLAQGSPISPVLANLYLDALDESFEKGPVRIVRFADDFLLLTRRRPDAEGALEKARTLLAAHGLELHPSKTRIVPYEQALNFLGHLFVRSLVLRVEEEEDNGRASITANQPVPQPSQPVSHANLPARAATPKPLSPKKLPARDAKALPQDLPPAPRLYARIAALDPLAELAEGRDEEDYAAGLAPLYVIEPGRTLAAEGESFAVLENGGARLRVPAAMVGRIDLGCEVEAQDAALRLAADHRIPVTLLDGRFQPQSVLLPAVRDDAGLHLAQARCALEPERRAGIAGMLAGARIRNAQALLKRLNRRRGEADVEQVCRHLHYGWRKAESARDIQTALAAEADGARRYWPALGRCLLHGFVLHNRREDEPRNPFNAILDYTAHLLTRDMRAAVLRARLHPGFGVLHASADGREACVYDLVEPFRAPLAEGLAVYLANNRILVPGDFASGEEGVRLSHPAARKLVQTYESWLARPVKDPATGRFSSWRSLLLIHARRFARAIEQGGDFMPYRLKH